MTVVQTLPRYEIDIYNSAAGNPAYFNISEGPILLFDASNPPPNGAYTFEFMLQLNKFNTVLFTSGGGGNSEIKMSISSKGYVTIGHWGSGGDCSNSVTGANPSTGAGQEGLCGVHKKLVLKQWYHLTGICDSNGNLKLYVDGILIGSRSSNLGSVGWNLLNNNNKRGLFSYRSTCPGGFDGNIRFIKFWNRIRTATELVASRSELNCLGANIQFCAVAELDKLHYSKQMTAITQMLDHSGSNRHVSKSCSLGAITFNPNDRTELVSSSAATLLAPNANKKSYTVNVNSCNSIGCSTTFATDSTSVPWRKKGRHPCVMLSKWRRRFFVLYKTPSSSVTDSRPWDFTLAWYVPDDETNPLQRKDFVTFGTIKGAEPEMYEQRERLSRRTNRVSPLLCVHLDELNKHFRLESDQKTKHGRVKDLQQWEQEFKKLTEYAALARVRRHMQRTVEV